jgi:hypothetical protein
MVFDPTAPGGWIDPPPPLPGNDSLEAILENVAVTLDGPAVATITVSPAVSPTDAAGASLSPAEIRLAMWRNGYPPIPCAGKKPVLSEWQKHHKTNEQEIRLWDKIFPYDSNTGCLTSDAPTFDVDITDRTACRVVFDYVKAQFEERGVVLCRIGNAPKFAVPFRTNTPFKKIKEEIVSPSGEVMKFEFLGDGQQFIAFGLNPDSKTDYYWLPKGQSPTSVPQTALPPIDEASARALVESLVALLVAELGYKRLKEQPDAATEPPPRTRRHNGPNSAYAHTALDRECDTVANAAPHTRNDTLNKAAFSLGQLVGGGELPEGEVARRLFDAAAANCLVKEDGAKATRATIRSGLQAGMKQPRTAPQPDGQFSARAAGGTGSRKTKDKAKETSAGGAPPEPPGSGPGQGADAGADDDPSAALLAEFNKDYCVVRDGGKTRVLSFERHEQRISARLTHTRLVPITTSFEDFRNFHLNQRMAIQVGDRTIRTSAGKWWLEHPNRRTYPGLVFDPTGSELVDGRLNLWRGWGVEPRPGDWTLMRRHIDEILANGIVAHAAYILNWLAWTVQHPSERAEVALAFRGKRGTGRGTLGNALVHIFGQHGSHLSSSRHVTGNFNAHMRDCCFLFADEAFWPGDHAAEGTLKRLITEPYLAIEAKHRDIVMVQNMLHVMFASNDEWLLPAGEHERRFAGFDVPDTRMQDEAWFDPLHKQLDSGGYGAMLYDLLRRPLGDFHPRRFPKTEMLRDQQALSLSYEDTWWVELLETAVLWGATSDHPNTAVSNEYEIETEISDGFGSRHTQRRKAKGLYDQAREISPRLRNHSDHAFGRFLIKMGCTPAKHLGPTRSRRGWSFPDLDSARTKWEEPFPEWKWRNPDFLAWEASSDD